MRRLVVVLFFVSLWGFRLSAQEGNASLTGFIQDPAKAFIQRVRVVAVNVDTGHLFETLTSRDGSYSISSLPVGPYRMQVEKPGFQTILKEGLFLHTQDVLQVNFEMAVGSTAETVTVSGDTNNINTTDGTVSTVVDRDFVNDIPLNGRSFQTLMLLTPGVVTTSPQGNDNGQLSVNGQRSDANYTTVDGASGNNGGWYWSGTSTFGMSSNFSALGTTQAIVPVDALEEFRMATSSYSAQFGRQPGAQMSFQTRSGTNAFHGDLYNYFRNYIFDANDWMNTYTTPAIPRPSERQNNFGGAAGGPLTIPGIFSGRDHAFFFVAYEGLRVDVPTAASIYYVPSNGTYNTSTAYGSTRYKNERQYAVAAMQPLLNAFPAPNCSSVPGIAPNTNAQCIDWGDGLSPYIHSGALPNDINTYFLRSDFQPTSWMRVFARYSDTVSTSQSYYYRGPDITSLATHTQVFMIGVDSLLRANTTSELRLQYSPTTYINEMDLPDGTNLNTLQGLPPLGGESIVFVRDTSHNSVGALYQERLGTRQFQPNAVDTLSWTHGAHLIKAGVDYRQTTSYLGYKDLSRGPGAFYYFNSASTTIADNPGTVLVYNFLRQDPTSKNFGLFLQDQWRIHPRLTMNLGLRWDVNPPPSISGAQQYTYSGDIHQPATVRLSALGAPMYQTEYSDIQPRIGAAYTLHDGPGRETVLRGGFGVFFDTIALTTSIGAGVSLGADNAQSLGYGVGKTQPFPVPVSVILAPIPTPQPPYSLSSVADPHLHPPSSLHWNLSMEQALGVRQSLTLTYVGSTGRDLITLTEYDVGAVQPGQWTTISQYENGPGSDYNAMQAQFRRQASRGLQVLGSYTWSHAFDSASYDSVQLPLQRGQSGHDVRNSLSAAMVYKVPGWGQNPLVHYLTSNWNLDLLVIARSAFPVEQTGATVIDPQTGEEYLSRLNYDGRDPYKHVPGIPGGRQFDPSVFSVPTESEDSLGNAPRNFLRGFGESAVDTAVERDIELYDRLNLQFRAEAFNLLNHPNFGALNLTCGESTPGAVCNNALMGVATNTLSNALGSQTGSGVTPISMYQQGGPRSLQFAVKLQF